jgi:hypothetical protein
MKVLGFFFFFFHSICLRKVCLTSPQWHENKFAYSSAMAGSDAIRLLDCVGYDVPVYDWLIAK